MQHRSFMKVTSEQLHIRHLFPSCSIHGSPMLHQPNCDWGRPCNCSECRENNTREICDVCHEGHTIHLDVVYDTDRKGVPFNSFTNYCSVCWAKHDAALREWQ